MVNVKSLNDQIMTRLEENSWIPQSELRSIVDRVVEYISISNPSSLSYQLKLIKFKDIFERVFTLYNLDIIKTNKKKLFSLEQIGNNSEKSIANITKEVLSVLKDIWNDSAFSSEFAKTLSEKTTSEKQSVASANRKGDGFMGDIQISCL
ncbi:hypothetical protein Glove_303g158 [Diversispora epigaea]|uniref:Uncharacterized protein n=1 Tax=Diversispora epigaea TaxID=1348612 RepID=A0A397HV16_9GLOM|nr:hypothetical protein Glove_303g158 [Diversispora epigaea]